jgi:DNA-binding NarL/FixJ family response regulator
MVIVVSAVSVLLLGSRRSTLEPLALALVTGRRFDVVGIETDRSRFWAIALDCGADIALVETNSVDVSAVRELVRVCPDTRIMLIGNPGDPQLIDLLVAGADGFFTRDVAPELIVEAVRMFGESGVLLPSPLSRLVLDRLRYLEEHFGAAGIEHPPLGKREALVLRMLTTGATNREIAKSLDVSVSTVKNQVAAVFKKLGASNRSEAVALAFRLGLAEETEKV